MRLAMVSAGLAFVCVSLVACTPAEDEADDDAGVGGHAATEGAGLFTFRIPTLAGGRVAIIGIDAVGVTLAGRLLILNEAFPPIGTARSCLDHRLERVGFLRAVDPLIGSSHPVGYVDRERIPLTRKCSRIRIVSARIDYERGAVDIVGFVESLIAVDSAHRRTALQQVCDKYVVFRVTEPDVVVLLTVDVAAHCVGTLPNAHLALIRPLFIIPTTREPRPCAKQQQKR